MTSKILKESRALPVTRNNSFPVESTKVVPPPLKSHFGLNDSDTIVSREYENGGNIGVFRLNGEVRQSLDASIVRNLVNQGVVGTSQFSTYYLYYCRNRGSCMCYFRMIERRDQYSGISVFSVLDLHSMECIQSETRMRKGEISEVEFFTKEALGVNSDKGNRGGMIIVHKGKVHRNKGKSSSEYRRFFCREKDCSHRIIERKKDGMVCLRGIHSCLSEKSEKKSTVKFFSKEELCVSLTSGHLKGGKPAKNLISNGCLFLSNRKNVLLGGRKFKENTLANEYICQIKNQFKRNRNRDRTDFHCNAIIKERVSDGHIILQGHHDQKCLHYSKRFFAPEVHGITNSGKNIEVRGITFSPLGTRSMKYGNEEISVMEYICSCKTSFPHVNCSSVVFKHMEYDSYFLTGNHDKYCMERRTNGNQNMMSTSGGGGGKRRTRRSQRRRTRRGKVRKKESSSSSSSSPNRIIPKLQIIAPPNAPPPHLLPPFVPGPITHRSPFFQQQQLLPPPPPLPMMIFPKNEENPPSPLPPPERSSGRQTRNSRRRSLVQPIRSSSSSSGGRKRSDDNDIKKRGFKQQQQQQQQQQQLNILSDPTVPSNPIPELRILSVYPGIVERPGSTINVLLRCPPNYSHLIRPNLFTVYFSEATNQQQQQQSGNNNNNNNNNNKIEVIPQTSFYFPSIQFADQIGSEWGVGQATCRIVMTLPFFFGLSGLLNLYIDLPTNIHLEMKNALVVSSNIDRRQNELEKLTNSRITGKKRKIVDLIIAEGEKGEGRYIAENGSTVFGGRVLGGGMKNSKICCFFPDKPQSPKVPYAEIFLYVSSEEEKDIEQIEVFFNDDRAAILGGFDHQYGENRLLTRFCKMYRSKYDETCREANFVLTVEVPDFIIDSASIDLIVVFRKKRKEREEEGGGINNNNNDNNNPKVMSTSLIRKNIFQVNNEEARTDPFLMTLKQHQQQQHHELHQRNCNKSSSNSGLSLVDDRMLIPEEEEEEDNNNNNNNYNNSTLYLQRKSDNNMITLPPSLGDSSSSLLVDHAPVVVSTPISLEDMFNTVDIPSLPRNRTNSTSSDLSVTGGKSFDGLLFSSGFNRVESYDDLDAL